MSTEDTKHERATDRPTRTARQRTPKQKMRFRLLVGIHYGRDYDADPTPILDAEGKVWNDPRTGEPQYRYPPKKYEAGQIVEDTVDLVKFGGPEKFAYVDGPPDTSRTHTPDNTAYQVAPGGQVLEGHQQTTSLPDGRSVTGRLDPEVEAEEREFFAQQQEEKQEKTQQKAQERDTGKVKSTGGAAKGRSHSSHVAHTTPGHGKTPGSHASHRTGTSEGKGTSK